MWQGSQVQYIRPANDRALPQPQGQEGEAAADQASKLCHRRTESFMDVQVPVGSQYPSLAA